MPTPLERGVFFPHAGPARRQEVRTAVAVVASLLLFGCDASRPRLSTAPVAASDADSVAAIPDETFRDPAPSANLATATTLGGPIAGLDAADLARFMAGQEEFEEEETVETGLGPIFNEASCVTCHDAPVGGTTGRIETRFGSRATGLFDPLAHLGGSLMQDRAIGPVENGNGPFTFVPEVVPAQATVTAGRVTTPLFGLGLVDAVPDAALFYLARLQAIFSPSTRGTPHVVKETGTGATRVGRFGWKAQVPTLHQFSGDAYLNEMGITNPEFPDENAPQGNHDALAFNPVPTLNDDGEDVESFTDFMTLLGPPPRGPRSIRTEVGGLIFRRIGCANCHTPTLVTGYSPVPALSRRVFQPWSDFLLHDMGALGDGIVQGQARGRQMRTAPLWGMGSRTVFLHDGRAKSAQDAILEHSGQGSYSRQRYARLYSGERAALLAFLASL